MCPCTEINDQPLEGSTAGQTLSALRVKMPGLLNLPNERQDTAATH